MAESKRLFTYGDRIRRKKGDSRVRTVADITDGEYHFTDGTFALISDQDCYEVTEKASGFFLVTRDVTTAPLDDYLHHGYEERYLFVDALRKLLDRWGGRTGQNVGERNKFLLLRFYDTPGGSTEEMWLPLYLLSPTDTPAYLLPPPPPDLVTSAIDDALGFD
jgi:hypothetical protein